jgi:hypothetical protein
MRLCYSNVAAISCGDVGTGNKSRYISKYDMYDEPSIQYIQYSRQLAICYFISFFYYKVCVLSCFESHQSPIYLSSAISNVRYLMANIIYVSQILFQTYEVVNLFNLTTYFHALKWH